MKRKTKDELGNPWPRILLSIPQERLSVPCPKIFDAFWKIAQQGWAKVDLPYMRCDMAHNKSATMMMQLNEKHIREGHPELTFTHLLSLDIDHIHPDYIVNALGEAVQRDPNKLVVSGFNFRRSEPYDPCAYFIDEHGNSSAFARWTPGIAKVDAIGAASLLVSADVFQRMKDVGDYPFFGYDYHVPGSDEFAAYSWEELAGVKFPGVDIYFSDLCRKHGIDIWVDTRVSSPHLGETWITADTWKAYQQTPEFLWEHQAYGYRLALLQKYVPELFNKPSDMLYVGANRQRIHYASEFKQAGCEITLLEIYPPNAAHYKNHDLVDHVVVGDVRNIQNLPQEQYDMSFWWHGPEHVSRDEYAQALAELEKHTRDLIVIGCPWGNVPNKASFGNSNEEHIGAYDVLDFERLGYTAVAIGTKDTYHSSLIAWKHKT